MPIILLRYNRNIFNVLYLAANRINGSWRVASLGSFERSILHGPRVIVNWLPTLRALSSWRTIVNFIKTHYHLSTCISQIWVQCTHIHTRDTTQKLCTISKMIGEARWIGLISSQQTWVTIIFHAAIDDRIPICQKWNLWHWQIQRWKDTLIEISSELLTLFSKDGCSMRCCCRVGGRQDFGIWKKLGSAMFTTAGRLGLDIGGGHW